MATTDLVIRTAEIKTKPIEELVGLIDKLSTGLDDLAKGGGPATKNINELRDELKKFETLAAEIASRRALFQQFGELEKGAQQAKSGMDEAKKALADYASTIPAARKRTDEQRESYAQLKKAADAATRSFQSAEGKLSRATEELKLIGVTAEQATAGLEALAAAETRVTAGVVQATKNVQQYHQAVRDLNAAEAARAAAQKRIADTVAGERKAAEARLQELLDTQKATQALREKAAAAREASAAVTKQVQAAQQPPERQSRLDFIAQGTPAATSPGASASALAEIQARQAEVQKGNLLTAASTKQLAEDHKTLTRAIADTQRQAGALDALQKAGAQYQTLGKALADAQQQLAGLATQAERTVGADEALTKALREQQALVERAGKAYTEQAQTLRRAQAAAERAGLDTRNLAQAERDIVQNATRTKQALDAATDSTTRLGQATGQAVAAQGKWGETQRTALSLAQRIRGQILSLTAAYVGLFGVINEAKQSLAATTTLQGINNRLGVAFGGDPKVVAEQLQFLRSESDRLGVSLEDLATGYSKFAVAAQAGGLSIRETQFVFSKFSEVARVNKLTAEESTRVFKALEQIMSKGKIASEELRGQLGDVLAGAAPTLAKALGLDKPGELDKALEKGQISSRALLQFAEEFGKKVKDQVVPASQSWQAEQGRLVSSLLLFRKAVADAGFEKAMTSLAKTLREALSGPDGAAAARGMGEAFSILARSAEAAVPFVKGVASGIGDIASAVKIVTGALLSLTNGVREMFGLKPVESTEDLAGAMYELGRAVVFLVGLGLTRYVLRSTEAMAAAYTKARPLAIALAEVGTAAAALGTATTAVIGLAAAVSGWELGTWLRENVKLLALFGLAFETLLQRTGQGMVKLAEILTGKNAAQAYKEMLAGFAVEDERYQRKRKEIIYGAQKLTPAEQALMNQRAQNRSTRSLLNEADAGTRGELGKLDPFKLTPGVDKDAQKAAREAATLLREVQRATAELEVRAARKGAEGVAEAMAAIDLQYQELLNKAEKIGGLTGIELIIRAEIAKDKLKTIAKNDAEFKAAEKNLKAIIETRDALIEEQKVRAELDPAQRLQAQQAEAQVLADYRDRVLEAARAALALAQAQGKVVEAAQLRGLIAKTEAQDPEKAVRRARLEDLQKELQTLQATRDARIGAAQAEANQADPTGATAAARTADILKQTAPEMERTARAAREMAAALGDTQAVAALDETLVKLREVDPELARIKQSIASNVQQGFTEAGVSVVDAFADMFRGISDAGSTLEKSLKGIIGNILKSIVQAIVQMNVMRATAALFGGPVEGVTPGPWASGYVPVKHNGGVVGIGSSDWSRMAPSVVFAGAARYHSGGLPGLRADEVPAILQKGEQVLAKNDPRNVLNGASAGAAAAQPTRMTIINTIDSESVVAAGLTDKAFVNKIAANKAAVKKLLA